MKHGRRDANHRDIIQALRDAYISVVDLADVAHGCPDLLAGGINRRTGEPMTTLLEIKTRDGKLTPDQVEFIEGWRGTVHVVRTVEEALAVFGVKSAITTKTPGAYNPNLDRGRHKGYAKRITKERVEALRAEGKPWAEVATILGVSLEAIKGQQRKWRRETKATLDRVEEL